MKDMEDQDKLKQNLAKLIIERVFTTNKEQQIENNEDPEAWLFDFRAILMKGDAANTIAELFYEEFKDKYPFQLCSLEIAGVPLMMSLMHKFYEHGHRDINAFFIRKSRKKSGLMRMVEGVIVPNIPVVCVDDLMNSGSSFWRQITVLEELECQVISVWSVLRFRDIAQYKKILNRGISVQTLFTLDDFTATLGDSVTNLKPDLPQEHVRFKPLWIFNNAQANYYYVVPKSQPILDEDMLYFGCDDRCFRALRQADGSEVWKFKVGRRSQGKSIFSSPCLFENNVYFGSYDGNVYALDKRTSANIWTYSEADFVGSSPAIAEELGLLFIGLEFGLIHKHGGIVALNAQTGEKIWSDFSHPAFTHSSPHYIPTHKQVIIGSNDGVARLYAAETGTLLWEFTTFGGASYNADRDGGFGTGDIKESFVYDSESDTISFGSIDGFLYVLDRRTGYLVHHVKCDFAISNTPYLHKGRVYFSSLDKHIRCLDLNTKKILFEKRIDGTRIFGAPIIINDHLYVGTNAGRLHELNPDTGEWCGYFQATERITNHIVYNNKTDRFFLPTYANQIISLKRIEIPEHEQVI